MLLMRDWEIMSVKTDECGRTMFVNIEHVLPCINKVIISNWYLLEQLSYRKQF